MHHGIDPGGRRDLRRQAEGQVGIEQRQVWQQQGRNHTHLAVLTGGDNGNRRHLRTGARRGRHLDQRQALPAGLIDPVDIAKLLLTLRVCKQCHQLGHVHGAATTETDDQICLHGPGLLHHLKHTGLRWIGLHPVEHLHRQALTGKAGQQRRQ
ncbi:hypothetical protein D3C76_1135690 [compost metagenome]